LFILPAIAAAQSGNLVGEELTEFGWMNGFGGPWLPMLLVVGAVGLMLWFVDHKAR
jgi:hypothetical protein